MNERTVYAIVAVAVLTALGAGGAALYRLGHKPMAPIEDTWAMYGKVPWQDRHNIDLARALVGENVRGCGIMDWKPNAQKPGRYLVACSQTGTFWEGYEVTLAHGRAPVVTAFHDFLTILPPRH